MIVVVKVSQLHIAKGKPNPYSNPVALAIKDELGFGDKEVSVIGHLVRIKNDRYILSASATKFVYEWDTLISSRVEMEPFTFKLDMNKDNRI